MAEQGNSLDMLIYLGPGQSRGNLIPTTFFWSKLNHHCTGTSIYGMWGSRGGTGVPGPPTPEKSQKHRVS